MIAPTDLREIIRSGLLSFPVTPFDADDNVNHAAFSAHLEWLSQHPVAGLIVAGGTGEMFSLTPSEIVEIVRTAKAAQPDDPILAGCGYGTRMACELAQGIEAAGGDGILLLPHYLIGAPQDGIEAHIRTVCKSTNMGVIVYNRGQSVVSAGTLAPLRRVSRRPPSAALRRRRPARPRRCAPCRATRTGSLEERKARRARRA